MNADLPTTIPAHLERLNHALDGCDPALAQDALYDAEDYLRFGTRHRQSAQVRGRGDRRGRRQLRRAGQKSPTSTAIPK